MLKRLKGKSLCTVITKDLNKGNIIIIRDDIYIVSEKIQHLDTYHITIKHVITRKPYDYKGYSAKQAMYVHEGKIRSNVAAVCVYWALYKQLRKIPKEIAKIIAKYVLWTHEDPIWNE